MKKKISRRDFLKISTGAATVATGLNPFVRRVVLEPFNQPPEEILPGQAVWYASTCGQCPAGCGIIVRVIDGQAKKIEGNPYHPLNKGKLCARGQAGLQSLYDPDRLPGAAEQSGGRGSRHYQPIYWEEAMDKVIEKIQSLSHPGGLAFIGGLVPDHMNRIATLFLDALGAENPYLFDLHSMLEGRTAGRKVSEVFFQELELPFYDIAGSDVVLSFGANLLETWMSPVSQGRAYGQFSGRGYFVQFEPRMSATAACADQWISLKPGTAGYAALAIGRIIVEERLGLIGRHLPFTELYQGVDIQEMASISEIPVERLRGLARVFAEADRAVAIPGGYLSGQSNGVASAYAVQALNLLVAQLGRRGGVFHSHSAPTPAMREATPLSSFGRVEALIERMKNGEVELVLIHSGNPVFGLPHAAGFREALANVPYVVSFSPFVDETAVQADLILPNHTYLESWGYRIPNPGINQPVVSNFQPVVQPVKNTRSAVDVFLSFASRLGGEVASALPWEDEAAYIEETITGLHGSSIGAYDASSPAAFWARWRQQGGWWSEKEIGLEPVLTDFVDQPLPIIPPHFEGDEGKYPYYFYPYPSNTLSDGRGANSPWLQETPDAMTTARWRSWVEVNPETAAKLGLEDNDLIRVVSLYGVVESPIVVYPGIRPDVVAMPVGQGHQDYGRFARQRGKNPVEILAAVTGDDGGNLAWGVTRVNIEPTGQTLQLARLESLDGKGRESVE